MHFRVNGMCVVLKLPSYNHNEPKIVLKKCSLLLSAVSCSIKSNIKNIFESSVSYSNLPGIIQAIIFTDSMPCDFMIVQSAFLIYASGLEFGAAVKNVS